MENKPAKPIQPLIDVKPFIQDEKVLKTYANGCIIQATGTDLFIVLQVNGEATQILNLSFHMAKGLANNLKEMIDKIEAKEIIIQSPSEMNEKLHSMK